MSEFDGGGSTESSGDSEMNTSSEVSEAPVDETGGEASQTSQEATTEEAGESGGFDHADNTEAPEDSDADYEDVGSDQESDESQEAGFAEDNNMDNSDFQYDDAGIESDTSPTDENSVGFNDSDGEHEDDPDGTSNKTEESDDSSPEDSEFTADGDVNPDSNPESVANTDDSISNEQDIESADLDELENEDSGEPEDYSSENNVDENADTGDNIGSEQNNNEAQSEVPDTAADGNAFDSDADGDGNSDGNFDKIPEGDVNVEDNIGGEQNNVEAQSEVPHTATDGDASDGHADGDGNSDGNLDDIPEGDDDADNNIDDEQADDETQSVDLDSTADSDEADIDADTDDNIDGEQTDDNDIDDYDEDEDEDPGEAEDYSEDDFENRKEDADAADSENESGRDKAAEENKESAEQAENKIQRADDEATGNEGGHQAEDESRNAFEDGAEPKTKPAENQGENKEVDVNQDSTREGDTNSTETKDTHTDSANDTHENSEFKVGENPDNEDAYRSAMSNMAGYMNEHNYGSDDYAEYSQDPEWQKLNGDLQQSLGMEVSHPVTTSPESDKDVSATEHPDNCVMVNASDIDMTYAQDMDNDQFWNHHGNTKEDYMRVAESIPDVQQALDSGKSLDEIKQDPDLKDTAHAYFDPENMVKVEQQADGSYSFADDGRHRIAAAQELGCEMPVQVINMSEGGNREISPSAKATAETSSPESTLPENIASKSDISPETCENLGSFEQNSWDNLSQVEKEQAVEKLRDSVAEDLSLENRPNIAYYFKEDSGDYGGYAASNNTIYINRFNMGDAAETADTIVHESRHCWQHERAENPQSEQDYQFKENFDDYIRPEDDFYEYQNQPVEADACEYAQGVRDAIPESYERPATESKQTHEEGDNNKSNDAPPSTTDPPEKTYEKSELPADFENKNGYQPLNEQAERKCQVAGLDKEQVQQIRTIPNGQKPNPEDYLSKDVVDNHLKNFEDEGCYKVIPGEPIGTVGKGDSLFVCRGSELEQALRDANGDPRKLEEALGMSEGYLGDNPYVVRVDNPQDLRVPTGNETNAWQDYWCPGGTTVGGMDEAVVNPPSPADYSFKPCFENSNSTSLYDDKWNKQ